MNNSGKGNSKVFTSKQLGKKEFLRALLNYRNIAVLTLYENEISSYSL